MEVITIESTAFKEILKRLEDLASLLTKLSKEKSLEEVWLDNYQVCEILKLSKRTLQRYRDNGTISFSQIGTKIYYNASDIEAFLMNHYVKSYKTFKEDES